MSIDFGREICGDLAIAQSREWLATNGLGSYASGTLANIQTRGYHGLLVAALQPPVGRTLMLSKLDETVSYQGSDYPLFTNRWADGTISPPGYQQIERFYLDGSIPVWHFACADALVEKRIWMQPAAAPGHDITYVMYTVLRASKPLVLSLKALVNYRDYHSRTHSPGWNTEVALVANGVRVTAYPGATPLFLLSDRAQASGADEWYHGLELAEELARGLDDTEDVLHAADFYATLEQGGSLTFAASLSADASLDGAAALAARRSYDQSVLAAWQARNPAVSAAAPEWIRQLVLAADQFIVSRATQAQASAEGKTVIAGYHWFTDWGRDTMISLPGLTLATGRPQIARAILQTFAGAVSRGMLPNRFPDDGSPPGEAEYNTVDATLWFFQAIRQYVDATDDRELLQQLFPTLAAIIEAHQAGTRYQIKLDPSDGLLHAGEPGVQLTWMDAKVGNWVVTPRIGKPVEVNALWYNALTTMARFADLLGQPDKTYAALAEHARAGYDRFWNAADGYCYDVLDGPDGADASLRPNQLFALALPDCPLAPDRQRSVLVACAQSLLVSNALRSLAPSDPHYQGHYGGDQLHRDSAYHQGTAWGWLLGVFAMAHLRVYGDPQRALAFLEPIAHHVCAAGLGTISEIFEGAAPMEPRGCIAQAWSVAEVLRAWTMISTPQQTRTATA